MFKKKHQTKLQRDVAVRIRWQPRAANKDFGGVPLSRPRESLRIVPLRPSESLESRWLGGRFRGAKREPHVYNKVLSRLSISRCRAFFAHAMKSDRVHVVS